MNSNASMAIGNEEAGSDVRTPKILRENAKKMVSGGGEAG